VITVKQSLHGMRLSQNIQTVIEYAHVVHRHVHRNVRLTCFVVLMYSLGSLQVAVASYCTDCAAY